MENFIKEFNPTWINFINTLTKNKKCRKEACELLNIKEETAKKYFLELKNLAIVTLAVAKHKNGEPVEFTINKHRRLNGEIDTLYSVVIYGSDNRKFKFHLKEVKLLIKILGEPTESNMTQEKQKKNKLKGSFIPRWDNFDWLLKSVELLNKYNTIIPIAILQKGIIKNPLNEKDSEFNYYKNQRINKLK